MPVKIIHPDHVEIVGLGHVLLVALHTASPDADLHTGTIVEEAALTSRSYAVIGKVSREFLDLNRIQSAQSEFRKSIEGFIAEDGIRYILDIRGKKEPGVNIGIAEGQTCSDSTTELVKSRLSKDFTVKVNSEYKGDEPGSIVTGYNRKDAEGNFVVETIQVEFGHEERQFQKEKVISDISEIADILNARLVA
ncbi:N-formylglutamate amidohydrolase [Candidatus Bathyarchaeota archaeon]|nr:MAG: N-formylglutamate amidohydrolase [Candidatus Bathyarchaeota archaeon]